MILIVDERTNRVPLVDYLEECGYKVIQTENAREALDMLGWKKTSVKLLITEFELPGTLDGAKLTKEALQLFPNLKVCVWSARAGIEWIPQAKTAGAHYMLEKPIRFPDLMHVLGLL